MQRNATDQNRTRQIFFLSFDGNEKILTQFRSLFAPPMHALSSCRYKFCFWVAVFFSSSFTGFQVFRSITFRVLDDSRRVDRSSTLSTSLLWVATTLSLSLSLSLVFAPNLRLVELRSGMPLGCLFDCSMSWSEHCSYLDLLVFTRCWGCEMVL